MTTPDKVRERLAKLVEQEIREIAIEVLEARLTQPAAKVHMYVWSDRVAFTAIAQAESVAKARELVLAADGLGGSGDGSCPERDKARQYIINNTPEIWYGPNAEFVLTDSAEQREYADYAEKLRKELAALKAALQGHTLTKEQAQAWLTNKLKWPKWTTPDSGYWDYDTNQLVGHEVNETVTLWHVCELLSEYSKEAHGQGRTFEDGRRAGLEEAAKVADENCRYTTRLCDPNVEYTCSACDTAAAIRALATAR